MATQPSPDSRAARTGNLDAAIFGLIVADVVAAPFDLRNPPAPGGMSLTDSIQLTTGGNVCNTGVAMAKLGMRVAAAGMVGKDILGSAVTEKLEREGLDTSCVFESDAARPPPPSSPSNRAASASSSTRPAPTRCSTRPSSA